MVKVKQNLKDIKNIAMGGLQLGGIGLAGSALGGGIGTGIGGMLNGYGAMLPATGSIYGAALLTGAARNLGKDIRQKPKRRY